MSKDFSDPVTLKELISSCNSADWEKFPVWIEYNGEQHKCMNFRIGEDRLILTDQELDQEK